MKAWWGSAALSLACAIGVVVFESSDREQPEQATSVAPEVTALLGGLEVGDAVAGWAVLGVHGPHQGKLTLDFGRDALRFSVTVAPLGSQVHAAPRTTDRYALYYGHPHPRGAKIPDGAIRAIMANLERTIRANEADVTVPGL